MCADKEYVRVDSVFTTDNYVINDVNVIRKKITELFEVQKRYEDYIRARVYRESIHPIKADDVLAQHGIKVRRK